MYLSTHLLGSTIVREIEERTARAVLTIGRDTFHRSDLAGVGCFNFLAAQKLSAACAALKPIDTRDLFARCAPRDVLGPGVGAVSIAVLGAAFEAKGLGGRSPLDAWYTQHRNGSSGNREFVTVHTMKAKERRKEQGRKRSRRR